MVLLTIAGVWGLQRRMTRDLAAARTEAAV
jgi:hypothetical protein